MTLQMAAIAGDQAASNMVTRVATAVGANPSEGDRLEAWLRLLKEDAKTSEGAVQPTKRTKNAHVRRSVQANLFGAPVSDQVILEQFAALSLEHKRTLEDAIAEGEVVKDGDKDGENDEASASETAKQNIETGASEKGCEYDENEDLETDLVVEYKAGSTVDGEVLTDGTRQVQAGECYTPLGSPRTGCVGLSFEPDEKPVVGEKASASTGPAPVAVASASAPAAVPAAVASAPAGETVTLVKYKQKVLVQGPFAMQAKLVTPGARDDIMSRFIGCDQVRGQTFRFVQVKFSGQPSERLARVLFVAACGTENNDAAVCLMPDEALILLRVRRRESRDEFKATPDLKFLMGDTIAVKHLTFAVKGAFYKQLVETTELLFSAAAVYTGNLRVQDQAATSEDDGILTMEEAYDALQKVRLAEYKLMCGDAKRAKFLKACSPLQQAIITMRSELDDYMKAKEQTSTILELASGVEYHLPRDFNPNVGTLLVGTFWSSISQSIQTMSLDQWRNTTEHKLRSMFLVGGNEAGKSSLLRALARNFCIRSGLETYAFLKKLDPAGLLTRSGEINVCSSFIFTDFEMRSLRDDSLDEESVKALLDTSEPGGYPARYHVATLPKNKPRMFAVNAGISEGTVDYGWWFAQQPHCYPLALLARGDEEGLRESADAEQAIARRTVIFRLVDRSHIGLRTQNAQQSLQAELDAELKREQEHADHEETNQD